MIRFFLVQNRQGLFLGKTRLAKYYVPYEEAEKRKVQTEIQRIIKSRSSRFTNFVEWQNYKVLYRRYAGLYFAFCVDANDNELMYLEAIHMFVEALDRFFGNVCELDLVFNFYKVYMILDEVILAGEIQETSKDAILSQAMMLDRLE